MRIDRELNAGEVSQEVSKSIAAADQQRAVELDRLRIISEAKASSMERESARLGAKLGLDHPRVKALTSAIETNRGFVRDLVIEVERARTDVPAVDPKSWFLHGYVRDQNLKGVAGLTVAVYDEKAAWIERLGFACTNEKGYFRLTATNFGAVDGPAFMRVLRNGSSIYADRSELKPEMGQVDYREIILSGDVHVCTPPPGSGTPINPDEPPTVKPPWTVRGQVSDGKSFFFAGLKVAIADKAGKFADRLGTRTTDENGKYEFIYPSEPFAALIDPPVDLFLHVLAADEKPLSTSPALHFEPGKTQIVNVTMTPGSFEAPLKEETTEAPAPKKRAQKRKTRET
jgi:hypothetical protein